jgi:hypothetical protein
MSVQGKEQQQASWNKAASAYDLKQTNDLCCRNRSLAACASSFDTKPGFSTKDY